MNCSKCENEMVAGTLVGEGGYWTVVTGIMKFFKRKVFMGAESVVAWKCPHCGNVELKIEDSPE